MLQPAYFVDRPITHGKPEDDAYARRNYDICQAVNLLKVGIVLDALVAAGMPKEQADCFDASARALLQLMRTENNRLRAPNPPVNP